MEIVTKKDLEIFKIEILNEISAIMGINVDANKRFLVSSEIRKQFHISETKLYELRRDGKIPYIKVDGKYLYDYNDVLNAFKLKGK